MITTIILALLWILVICQMAPRPRTELLLQRVAWPVQGAAILGEVTIQVEVMPPSLPPVEVRVDAATVLRVVREVRHSFLMSFTTLNPPISKIVFSSSCASLDDDY